MEYCEELIFRKNYSTVEFPEWRVSDCTINSRSCSHKHKVVAHTNHVVGIPAIGVLQLTDQNQNQKKQIVTLFFPNFIL